MAGKTHVAAFFENQDGAGALQNLAALADPLSPLFQRDATGDLLRVPGELPFIALVHAHVDATVQPRARLTASSFKETYGRSALELPVLSSAAEPLSPPAVNDFRADPIRLKPSELLGLETLNNPAAAADQFVVVFFSDGPVQPVSPAGGRWCRFITTAAALTADTWNARSLTQDENLAAGRYEVLGMRCLSTSLIAARLSFTGQSHKPGVLGADARADIPSPTMLPGQMGSFGTFDTDTLPQIELLADAADNEVQVVDLYIKPVGAGRGR